MWADRKFRLARIWSNRELAKFAHLFTGDIVNVSGWKDWDKQNKHYRDYFTAKSSFTVTNFSGYRGIESAEGTIELDLELPLQPELKQRFDVVFNHTTLEHIFDVSTAFKNLCLLSRDIVILVVPFSQVEHTTETLGDYWRFAPQALRKMFAAHGFTVLYEAANEDRNAAVYLFFIASKKPDLWAQKIQSSRLSSPVGKFIGESRIRRMFRLLRGQS